MKNIVILSVAIIAVILVFAFAFITYIFRRRRSRHVFENKPAPFTPSYNVVTRSSMDTTVDTLGANVGPDVSPVTPTEFFSAGTCRFCYVARLLRTALLDNFVPLDQPHKLSEKHDYI